VQLSVTPQEFLVRLDPDPVETIVTQNWDNLGLHCGYPSLVGLPPIPFTLTAAWVVEHIQHVNEIVHGQRSYFSMPYQYAPPLLPLVLHQEIKVTDKLTMESDAQWRDTTILLTAQPKQ
jgi:hypothetical protein